MLTASAAATNCGHLRLCKLPYLQPCFLVLNAPKPKRLRAGFGSAPRELKILRRLVALAKGSSATAARLSQRLGDYWKTYRQAICLRKLPAWKLDTLGIIRRGARCGASRRWWDWSRAHGPAAERSSHRSRPGSSSAAGRRPPPARVRG